MTKKRITKSDSKMKSVKNLSPTPVQAQVRSSERVAARQKALLPEETKDDVHQTRAMSGDARTNAGAIATR